MKSTTAQVDHYVWGTEVILWGFEPDHQYTYKLLRPKKGRAGCLSLQSHDRKSETWLVTKGIACGIVIEGSIAKTIVLREGDYLNLPAGTIHRLMAVTDDCIVAEASTPDAHAADKTVTKDVVRYHCVHGRPCVLVQGIDVALINAAIRLTDTAIDEIDAGIVPVEREYRHVRLP